MFVGCILFPLVVVTASACNTPDPNATTTIAKPDRASFDQVANAFVHRCGSLDCHGSRYRNLRMWSHDGMRLAIGDVPGGNDTTEAEDDSNYAAIVDLEPEIMSAVVSDHGANPERLTFIRKMRGTEAHVGGTIVYPGDPRDLCVTSWLSGTTDANACARALTLP